MSFTAFTFNRGICGTSHDFFLLAIMEEIFFNDEQGHNEVIDTAVYLVSQILWVCFEFIVKTVDRRNIVSTFIPMTSIL